MENETIDNFDPRLLEYPFVKKGMTIAEYRKEKKYFFEHLKDYHNGTYKPLWQQG